MASKRPTYPMEELFLKLKDETGFSLGIDELMAMQKALASGFGVHSLAELRSLCHLLWSKSKAQSFQLNHHFDKLYANKKLAEEELPKETSLPASIEIFDARQEIQSRSLSDLSLIHISEPTRPLYISYAVFCLKKTICS